MNAQYFPAASFPLNKSLKAENQFPFHKYLHAPQFDN